MRPKSAVALGVLFGVALGATAINGLKAQGTPPAYVVINVAEMTDPAAFNAALTANSAASTAEMVAPGGHYVVRTTTTTALDGIPPKRFVVIAFDSKEKAQAWFDSPKTKAIGATRLKTTRSSAFIVEGTAN